MRTYLAPILLSVGFVLLSPLALFTIFLSGDSCCGENTTGTMVGVTVFIVVVVCGVALAISSLVKLVVKGDFSIPLATAIMAGPTALICIVFVTVVSATAFS